jgi:hypothetical protein
METERTRRSWLASRFGINFVAVGIVATFLAVAVIEAQDVSFCVTGAWPKMPWYRDILYQLFAGVAAIFWGVNSFFFRSKLPRFAAVIIAMSFGSYIVQPFHNIPSHQLTALCLARLLGFCGLLLLARTYIVDLKAGRVAR